MENSITPRRAKTRTLKQSGSEPANLQQHAQPNGFVKLPFELCKRLTPQQKDELRACNDKGNELRKRKLDGQGSSTVLPPFPVITPRDVTIAPASKKLRKEDLLRDMERLIDGCQGPVPELGAEPEVEDTTQRGLPTVTFHVASKKK